MESQKKLIHGTNWDTLIILDACRYGYFEDAYTDYIDGKLKRVRSGAIHTAEWLTKTFEEYYSDITYISGIPQVNSLGISLRDMNQNWDCDWKATNYFSKIIDVWDFGWSKNLRAVPPMIMNETFVQTTDENKKIIHYNQPHTPYLSLTENCNTSRRKSNMSQSKTDQNRSKKIRDWLGRRLNTIFSREFIWKIKKIMGLFTHTGSIEHGWRNGTVEYYYKDNLGRALEAVSELIDNLNGKIVITADHGECLGERGYWGHGFDLGRKIPRIPVLVEVPWLEVEK